jgi:hypothetical protein
MFILRENMRFFIKWPRSFKMETVLSAFLTKIVGWVEQTAILVGLRSQRLGLQNDKLYFIVRSVCEPHQGFATSTHL